MIYIQACGTTVAEVHRLGTPVWINTAAQEPGAEAKAELTSLNVCLIINIRNANTPESTATSCLQ